MEKVDIYNNKRKKLDYVKERDKLNKGEYRISAHIWIIDKNQNMLIQKRAVTEDKFPGMWSQTGGGVVSGESSLDTVKRETKEELGIDTDDSEIIYIGSYIRKKDIVDIWLIQKENININQLSLQLEEVEEVKLVSFQEFDNMIEQKNVVPSINPSYFLLKNYYEKYKEFRE